MNWPTSNNAVLIKALLQKNIRKSFHKSILGVVWHMVIPTIQLFIFFNVYGAINAEIDIMATIVGLFIWLLFNNAIYPSILQTIAGKSLIMNVNLPPSLIPASTVIMSILFTSLFVLSASAFIIYYGVSLSSGLFVGIPIILLFLVFTYSIALIISLGNIYFRDIGMLWNSFSFLLFLTAPILYPINILPGILSTIAQVNPITQFISALRVCCNYAFTDALFNINWLMLFLITGTSLLLAAIINHFSKKTIIANL